jgi:hypothetical protein
MKVVWCFMKSKLTSILFLSTPWSYSNLRFWFGHIKSKQRKARMWWSGKRSPDLRGKELTREVAYVETPDGRETFKITVKASGLGGKGSSAPVSRQLLEPEKAGAVKPAGVGS